MTNIFHDWEFYEDGRTITPISVGIVADTGESFYAIFDNAGYVAHKTRWLVDNVYPHISRDLLHPEASDSPIKNKAQIALDIQDFIGSFPDPELWAWYGAYDHVVLAQTLGGPMIHMPEDIPWYTNDIKTLEYLAAPNCEVRKALRERAPKQDPSTEHHALHDAFHDFELFKYYTGLVP